MTSDVKTKLEVARLILGKRRMRIIRAMAGQEVPPSVRDIASRLRISKSTVHRELQTIAQLRQEWLEAERAVKAGVACPFPAPSLN
jgi:Fe2+ or Zn2+ uptake regulation protein